MTQEEEQIFLLDDMVDGRWRPSLSQEPDEMSAGLKRAYLHNWCYAEEGCHRNEQRRLGCTGNHIK